MDLARALVAPAVPVSAVEDALAEAGLADVATRRVGGFSRGMLQRLGIGGLAGTTSVAGKALRLLQTGNIQSYAFLFGLGVTVIIYYVVVK